MFIDNYIKKKNISSIGLNKFEIASDICDDVLQKCSTGLYDNMSMERGIDDYYLNLYFTKLGKSWSISPIIKNAVTFKKVNLKTILKRKITLILCYANMSLYIFQKKVEKKYSKVF